MDSERAQKLAIFGGAVAFAVAYHWICMRVFTSGPEVYRAWVFAAAGVSWFLLLATWLVPLAQGKIPVTFFDRAVGLLLLANAVAWVGYALVWGRTVESALQALVASFFVIMPVPVALLLLLGVLLGRDRFEAPGFYLGPPRRERPVHVRIIRRVTLIGRKRD